jgi:hypothetical protein
MRSLARSSWGGGANQFQLDYSMTAPRLNSGFLTHSTVLRSNPMASFRGYTVNAQTLAWAVILDMTIIYIFWASTRLYKIWTLFTISELVLGYNFWDLVPIYNFCASIHLQFEIQPLFTISELVVGYNSRFGPCSQFLSYYSAIILNPTTVYNLSYYSATSALIISYNLRSGHSLQFLS